MSKVKKKNTKLTLLVNGLKKTNSQFRGIKRDIPKIEIIKTITMYLGYS